MSWPTSDERRAQMPRLLGYRVTINNGILRKLCEKFGCSYNARSKTRVAGVLGATEQGKQLSVVTDAAEGVYRPTIVLGSPTTASGRAVKRCASILTLQMSHPYKIKLLIQATQRQDVTP